jgi:hypothetical protein
MTGTWASDRAGTAARQRRWLVPPLCALIGLGTLGAAPPQDGLARTLSGLKRGAPVQCIRRDQFSNLEPHAGTILYTAGRNRFFRNDVTPGCPGLARGEAIVVRTFNGRYCAGDIIQTRGSGGMLTGSCKLGTFVPYAK